MKWDKDQTTLHAAPGEAWILQGINALTIYPKVRALSTQAFAPPPAGRTQPRLGRPSVATGLSQRPER